MDRIEEATGVSSMEEILEKIARHPEAIESLNKSETILKKALKEAIKEN